MRFADSGFQQRLRDALNADEEFALESRWFDGSILLESGAERCWLKIYRGQVIDHLEFIPPFGYTFKLTASPEAWRMLAEGERTFTDLATPPARGTLTRPLEEVAAGGGGYRPPTCDRGQWLRGRPATPRAPATGRGASNVTVADPVAA